MDLKSLLSGIDLSDIENHLKSVIELVKSENKETKLIDGEDNVYIILDILKNDIIAYRVTSGVTLIDGKNYLEIRRTLGKWNIEDIKNLIGEQESITVTSKLKKLLPIIDGFISLMKLEKNEKKISIQLNITDTDIEAYQIALAILNKDGINKLVVNRILGKYNLNEYIK